MKYAHLLILFAAFILLQDRAIYAQNPPAQIPFTISPGQDNKKASDDQKANDYQKDESDTRFVKIILKNGTVVEGKLIATVQWDSKTDYLINEYGEERTYNSSEISQVVPLEQGGPEGPNFYTGDLVGDYERYLKFIKKNSEETKQWSDAFKDESILFRQNLEAGQSIIEQVEVCHQVSRGLKKYISKMDNKIRTSLNVKLNPEFRTYHRRLILNYQQTKILLTGLNQDIENKINNQESTCQIDVEQFRQTYQKDISEIEASITESANEIDAKISEIVEQRKTRLREAITGLRGLSPIVGELRSRAVTIIDYEKKYELAKSVQAQEQWLEVLKVEKSHLSLYLASLNRIRRLRTELADMVIASSDERMRDRALMALRHLTYALDALKDEKYENSLAEMKQYLSIADFFKSK